MSRFVGNVKELMKAHAFIRFIRIITSACLCDGICNSNTTTLGLTLSRYILLGVLMRVWYGRDAVICVFMFMLQ